jgi:hypothetical protein
LAQTTILFANENSVPPTGSAIFLVPYGGSNTIFNTPDLKSFPQNRQIIASHWRFLVAGGDDNWGCGIPLNIVTLGLHRLFSGCKLQAGRSSKSSLARKIQSFPLFLQNSSGKF